MKEVLASPLFWELQLASFRKRCDGPSEASTSANEVINKLKGQLEACRTKCKNAQMGCGSS